jgi:hypothetical protein
MWDSGEGHSMCQTTNEHECTRMGGDLQATINRAGGGKRPFRGAKAAAAGRSMAAAATTVWMRVSTQVTLSNPLELPML